jgi:hypothetical protein
VDLIEISRSMCSEWGATNRVAYSARARAASRGRIIADDSRVDGGTGVRSAVRRKAAYPDRTITAVPTQASQARLSRPALKSSHVSQSVKAAIPLSLLNKAAKAQAAAPITQRAAARSPGTSRPVACAFATRASAEKANKAASESARPLT